MRKHPYFAQPRDGQEDKEEQQQEQEKAQNGLNLGNSLFENNDCTFKFQW